MIIFIYICFILFALLFVYYPTFSGNEDITDISNYREKEDKDYIDNEDKIISIKASLKDIHLENQIGKLADSDFEILRRELLKEWSYHENMKKKMKWEKT